MHLSRYLGWLSSWWMLKMGALCYLDQTENTMDLFTGHKIMHKKDWRDFFKLSRSPHYCYKHKTLKKFSAIYLLFSPKFLEQMFFKYHSLSSFKVFFFSYRVMATKARYITRHGRFCLLYTCTYISSVSRPFLFLRNAETIGNNKSLGQQLEKVLFQLFPFC
jgi:hypothetical protein